MVQRRITQPECNTVCVFASIHTGTYGNPRCVRVRSVYICACHPRCRDGSALQFAHTHSREHIRIKLRYDQSIH